MTSEKNKNIVCHSIKIKLFYVKKKTNHFGKVPTMLDLSSLT